ncbi:MAG: hypothetical protein ASUL_03694 [Candidatus Aramenus sulfurataquae]|jgi:hypothetical protein|uniref:Uncharacterized protein n=2 Tax=Candidatus Aramenus sulfurataquae TaxID=1326980 RepID=W7L7A8_9CREN|nr:MAG: hypothetical protein ASUL_03694 [Candidatus Aramenus sulfurataquae]MCL7343780.1 hypothetical protein [Candidatus Aramenus sulfurataquae]
MSYDERTTSEAVIEINFNLYAFRESVSNYQVSYQDGWIVLKGKEGEYLSREFDNYAVLVYPVNAPKDLLEALSVKNEKIDKFREILYKPRYWRESVTIHLVKDKLVTGTDIELVPFNGVDLVNDILRTEGAEFKTIDDNLVISVTVERPLTAQNLGKALYKLSVCLSLYYRIKEAQEDIALKIAQEALSELQ